MEQENRIRAALVKLNLTVAATDKLDDAVELVEADQAAVTSDFAELKEEVQHMRTVIETKEIEQDAKLVRLVEQRHIDVNALTTELEAKMSVVEATFVKVEGLMFELESATKDRKRHEEFMKDLPGGSQASSSAVLPSTGGPEIILLKSRVERMGQELSEVNGSVCGVRQAVVDVEDRLIGTEVKINELVVQTAMQTSQTAAQLVAEREAILRNQIEQAIVEVGKGACQCPQGCPGRTAGQPSGPPGIGATGASRAGGRPPLLNASGRYNAPGDHGGDGPGGGGGGGGRPAQPAAHDIFSEDGHKKLLKSSKSPFDSKAARDELPRFNGKEKAELWRKKVAYYLHSKNANMRNLLRWAELQTEEITEGKLAEAAHYVDSLAMLSDDPEVLSYHLWGFLNVNLVDAAWDLFDGVDIENGLEVWRVVNLEITQKTQSELLALEDQVLTPHRVSEIRDIDKALVAWDAALRNYIEAGGTGLSKHRQVGAIMRLIPPKVRDQALWEFDKFDGKPDVLRKWIKDRTQWFTKADVTRPGGAKAHMLNGDFEEFMSTASEDDLSVMEGMSDGELCAFVRKKLLPGQRNATRGAGPGRERQAPPRDKRDITCPNCLKKGHTGQECRQPKIASKDRKCFECGEPGHVASKCPNKDKAKALTEEATGVAKPVWLGCVADSQDIPVHRKKMTPWHKAMVPRPKPRGCTLGDCMGSAFAKMAELERAEDTFVSMPILEDNDDEEEKTTAHVAETQQDAEEKPWDPEIATIQKRPCTNEATMRAPLAVCGKTVVLRPSTSQLTTQKRNDHTKTTTCRTRSGARSCVPTDEAAVPKPLQNCTSPQINGEHAGRVGEVRAQAADGVRSDAHVSVRDLRKALTEVPSVPVNAEHAGRVGRRGAHQKKQRLTEAFKTGCSAHSCTDSRCQGGAGTSLPQRWAARRQAIRDSKVPAEPEEKLIPSWHQDIPMVPAEINNFWGVETVDELNALPDSEPEFLEVEMTLDTGATVHACDRVDFPGCVVLESPGSRAGQQFQAAGGKLIPNEGQANILICTLDGVDMAMTMQIAKITRPLLSVTKMTESGEISVLCKKDEALVLDSKGKTLAKFNRKGGLYVCIMKYRNPKFKAEGFARPHE